MLVYENNELRIIFINDYIRYNEKMLHLYVKYKYEKPKTKVFVHLSLYCLPLRGSKFMFNISAEVNLFA